MQDDARVVRINGAWTCITSVPSTICAGAPQRSGQRCYPQRGLLLVLAAARSAQGERLIEHLLNIRWLRPPSINADFRIQPWPGSGFCVQGLPGRRSDWRPRMQQKARLRKSSRAHNLLQRGHPLSMTMLPRVICKSVAWPAHRHIEAIIPHLRTVLSWSALGRCNPPHPRSDVSNVSGQTRCDSCLWQGLKHCSYSM